MGRKKEILNSGVFAAEVETKRGKDCGSNCRETEGNSPEKRGARRARNRSAVDGARGEEVFKKEGAHLHLYFLNFLNFSFNKSFFILSFIIFFVFVPI